LHRVLDTAEAVAEQRGRCVEVLDRERDAVEPGGLRPGGRVGPDELENRPAETEEGLREGRAVLSVCRWRRGSMPCTASASIVRAGSGDITTRWSSATVLLACDAGSAGGGAGSVGSPSTSTSPGTPATAHPLIFRPWQPRRMATPSTAQTPSSSIVNPSARHASGSAATSSATSSGTGISSG